jgi:hypothetical protein
MKTLVKLVYFKPRGMVRRKGRITADLRQAGEQWWLLELPESMGIWREAARNLGLVGEEWKTHLGDIASEAIEHAEALGL